MNFLDIAQQDKAFTLKDSEFGFGTEITLTDPDLFTAVVTGRTNDISFAIDANTGQAVSGRTATIAIDIVELQEKGFSDTPKAQTDKTKKPWIVEWTDPRTSKSYSFTILEANPDRTLNILLCTLSFYKK
jgi:hypothetical protein